jgi:C4-type Zn-finger protein
MMKEGVRMDKPQTNSNVEGLKTRLHQFLETLESIEPETADLQDIDQLISMLDELEEQMDKLKTDN